MGLEPYRSRGLMSGPLEEVDSIDVAIGFLHFFDNVTKPPNLNQKLLSLLVISTHFKNVQRY